MFFPNKKALFLICLTILVPLIYANAQWGGESLSISVFPENPRPNQDITLSITSFSTSIGGSDVIWYVDDEKISEGIGLSSINIKMPDVGKSKNVRVVVNAGDGSEHEQTVLLSGADVTLTEESRTYVPQMFPGRAKHVNGSYSVIQAIPDIKDTSGIQISPSNLVYIWKKNGRVLQDASGYGKDSYIFFDDSIDASTGFSVTASTRDGQFSASDSISTRRFLPTISFFKYSLLYGTDFGAQGNSFLGSGEIGVRVVPVYYPVDLISRFVSRALNWKLSGKPIDTKNLPFLIIQSPDGGGSGELSVSIKDPNYFGEDVPKTAKIEFKQ